MDDINSQIEDINQRLDDNDASLSDFSDSLDSSISDIQSTIETLDENSGQLTFPLNQDTKDLIDEQTDNGLKTAIDDIASHVPTPQQSQLTQDYATLITLLAVGVTSHGYITMINGYATIVDPVITPTSIIIYSRGDLNGSIAIGLLFIFSQGPGGATIQSLMYDSSGTEINDNSIINYLIFNI